MPIQLLMFVADVYIFCLFCHVFVQAREVEILSTSKATSNLVGWRIENYVDGIKSNSSLVPGWGEVSVFNGKESVRGFEVCPESQPVSKSVTQSWLRSPVLNVTGVTRLYVSFKFWMRECHDLKDTICRETFKVFYRLISKDEHLPDTVPLNESHFTKVDTVAAEVRFLPNHQPESHKINKEMVSIAIPPSADPQALYVAIMDEGACISLTSLRVYYIMCPSVVNELAAFPETHTGQQDTSLVEVVGQCVANAVPTIESQTSISTNIPVYRCTSSGDWKVQTGACECKAGYQPGATSKKCSPCPIGYYKPAPGNTDCIHCPRHAYTTHLGSTQCQCSGDDNGRQLPFQMNSASDSIRHEYDCEVCSKLPTAPTSYTVKASSESLGTIQLSWEQPEYFGRCRKVTFCILCHACPLPEISSQSASASSPFSTSNPSSLNSNCSFIPTDAQVNLNTFQTTEDYCDHLTYDSLRCQTEKLHITIGNLRGQTRYGFSVVAVNGYTVEQYPVAFALLKGQTNLSSMRGSNNLEQEMVLVLKTSAATEFFTTNETLPSPVVEMRRLPGNQSSAVIKWNPPHYPNGKIKAYQVWWFQSSDLDHFNLSVESLLKNNATNLSTSENSVYLKSLLPKTSYYLSVRPENSAGFGNFSPIFEFSILPEIQTTEVTQNVTTPAASFSNYIYLIAAAVVFFVLFATFVALWFKCSPGRRNKKASHAQYHAPQNGTGHLQNDEHTECTTVPEQRTYVDPFSLGPMLPHQFSCETLPNLITTDKVIGCGEFGEVYQGRLLKTDIVTDTDETLDVAVKQLHAQCEPHEQLDYLREAMALERFQHPNIVKLEAVVMKSRPFMIVTELMDHGCLEAFLRAHRQAHKAFPAAVLVRMLRGVALGMEYLSGMQYVHRDLAARNVLVNSDLVCKVSDFGLTRHMGANESDSDCSCPTYTTQGGKIAIRWTAPEAVAFRAYSQASDVWSFGVFAWEVTTYGEKPYWDLTNQQVLQAVNEGFRLPAPEDCPSVLHQLMLSCWQRDRHARPTFADVGKRLEVMLDDPDSLLILASPASTGADDAFFSDSSSPSPVPPMPTLTEGQSHHNYATCQEVTDDADCTDDADVFEQNSRTFGTLLAKPTDHTHYSFPSRRDESAARAPLLGDSEEMTSSPVVTNPYAASIV
uniref:receptor protein-tyrosine kinase n=1 Tax=Phallusia mammillata TaxID=59560 RepID=A0A6F9DCQ3_9ASCI|nr:Eph-like ephrin receptor like protein precursor [Phallusia mammillata]